MNNQSDEKLVQIYLRGDEKALEKLINRYLPLIYNFSRRYSGDADNASDIAQEIFVKVWKNIKKPAPYRIYSGAGFDPKKGSFKAWIFTIAKNTALDWLKKRRAVPISLLKEYQENEENLLENIADQRQISTIDEIYKNSISYNLKLAILKLPPKYNSVINLRHNQGLNFREISNVLNESINTVKSRYKRGLAALRKMLLR